MNAEIWLLYFDGSCNPNPGGIAAYGYVLEKTGDVVEEGHDIIGQNENMTSNLAEHFAIAEGMLAFLKYYTGTKGAVLLCRGDSQLVIKQLNGQWKANHQFPYYSEYLRARELLKVIRKKGVIVQIDWIPRAKNDRCDKLSKAYKTKENDKELEKIYKTLQKKY